jgi:hypothetical protein
MSVKEARKPSQPCADYGRNTVAVTYSIQIRLSNIYACDFRRKKYDGAIAHDF